MRALRSLFVLVALAALTMTTLAPAAAAPGKDVPLRGTITTYDTMYPPTGCPDHDGYEASWRYDGPLTGTLSHLGRVSGSMSHCSYVTELTGDPEEGSFTMKLFGPRSEENTITLRAANGDTLVLAHAFSSELWFDADTGESSSTGVLTWEVVGGTGRFTNATGAGEATVHGDLAAGTTSGDFVGTIRYDASDRSLG